MKPLRALDIFQIATSILFLGLGTVTAAHSLADGIWAGGVVGTVMASYGVYRCRLILRSLREAGR